MMGESGTIELHEMDARCNDDVAPCSLSSVLKFVRFERMGN